MALRELVAALSIIVAASPASAALPQPTRESAPTADASAKYCLRVEPVTGSRIETIECNTRDEWAQLDVDVDQEWADNGVRVEG
jgi:hypothetical protein